MADLLRSIVRGRWTMLALVAPVCAGALLLAGHLTARTAGRAHAWQAALVESEARLTLSHLWLEERLSGDGTVDARTDVLGNLAFAGRACRALVSGGDPGGGVGRIAAVDDRQVRRAVARACRRVGPLRALTVERLDGSGPRRPGSPADQRYDRRFDDARESFEHAARTAAAARRRNGDVLARINVGAVGLLLGLFLVAAGLLHRRDRQREDLLGRQDLMIANMHDAFVTMDHAGVLTAWNPAAESVFGWRSDEVVGRRLATVIIPERYHAAHDEGLGRYLATGKGRVLGKRLQLSALHRNGTEFPVELTITAIRQPHRDPMFAAFLRDVTALRRADRFRETRLALANVLATAGSVPDAAPEALAAIAGMGWDCGSLWLFDERTAMLRCAAVWRRPDAGLEEFASASRDLRLAPGEGLPGRVFRAVEPEWLLGIGAEDPAFPRAPQASRARLATGVGLPLMAERGPIGALEFFSREPREAPEPGLLDTLADLSELFAVFVERRRAEERLREHAESLSRLEVIAHTDDLTGLLNRRGWNEQLARELERARREWEPLTVALIDLDHFKRFNDTHGHPAGDRLLKEAAAAWRTCLRVTDVIARYGGEEFAIALPASLGQACPLLERLRTAVPAGETCSVGAVEWDATESAESLIRRADAALYAAKQRGRDRIEVA